jgi:hypothetical protein
MGHILPASPSCLTCKSAHPGHLCTLAYFGRKTTFAACQSRVSNGLKNLQIIGIHTATSAPCSCSFLLTYYLMKYMFESRSISQAAGYDSLPRLTLTYKIVIYKRTSPPSLNAQTSVSRPHSVNGLSFNVHYVSVYSMSTQADQPPKKKRRESAAMTSTVVRDELRIQARM